MDDEDLRAGWVRLLDRRRMRDDGLAGELLARYAEAHRRYHGVAHLRAVVATVEELAPAVGLSAEGTDAALLAAWFHDAVYDPRAADNEARSADLAADALGARGAGADLVVRVPALVLATAAHGPADGPDAAVLLDADLAILAAPAARYDAYAAQVREEYAFVPEDAFRAGRAAVLHSLLDGPLFQTAPMRPREPAARANLERELRRLTA